MYYISQEMHLHCMLYIIYEGKKSVVLHDHWGRFKKTLNQTNCGKWASDIPCEAQPSQNQTYFVSEFLRLNAYFKS